MDPIAVVSVLGTWGYPALLLLLILTGLGSPIPEDLLLLTAGYLVFVEVFQWPLALAVAATGVVASDLMLYSAGRHIGRRAARASATSRFSPRGLLVMWFRWGPEESKL